MSNSEQLRQIRCSCCGRFLGIGNIVEGEAYLKCKCKSWTVVLGGEAEKNLTGEEMYERIKAVDARVAKAGSP